MTLRQRGLLTGILAIEALLAGCAHGHIVTVPDGQVQESATPLPTLPPVVLYAIPPTEPKGKVCIRSLGREQLPGPRGRLLSFLHISMVVENIADPASWTLDRRDMKLNFIGSRWPVSPQSKTSTKGATLAIPQGESRELDLYFPSTERSRPLHVSFLWKLHRGSETDTVSTRFESTGPIPTVSEGVGGPPDCGQLSHVADRHATLGVLPRGNPL
jgi:hypothetical protein